MAKLSLRALWIFSAKRSDIMAFVKDVDTCSIVVVMDKRQHSCSTSTRFSSYIATRSNHFPPNVPPALR